MQENISWDLPAETTYEAGAELQFALTMVAPETGRYYCLGGLYTTSGAYISGSLFGILKAAEVDYGVNDPAYMTIWELEPEGSVDLPCRFILDRTNCLLALFLMKMVGDEPSLDDDEPIAQVSVGLAAPQTVWEQIQDVISQNIMPIVVAGMMLGMVAMMGRGMFKR